VPQVSAVPPHSCRARGPDHASRSTFTRHQPPASAASLGEAQSRHSAGSGARALLLSGDWAWAKGLANRGSNGSSPNGAPPGRLAGAPATRTSGLRGQCGRATLHLSERSARRRAAWTPHQASRQASAERWRPASSALSADDHAHRRQATAPAWPIPTATLAPDRPTERHPQHHATRRRSPPNGRSILGRPPLVRGDRGQHSAHRGRTRHRRPTAHAPRPPRPVVRRRADPLAACPLLRQGRCPLADAADLLVFACPLDLPLRGRAYRGRHLLHAHRTHPDYGRLPLVLVAIELIATFTDPAAVLAEVHRLLPPGQPPIHPAAEHRGRRETASRCADNCRQH
jgi:hypothetical protein